MPSKISFVVLVALLVGASALLVACKPTSKCSASSCNGCCSDLGQCLVGSANAACGRGGNACKTCGATETCVATTGTCLAGMGGGTSGTGGGTSGTGGGSSGTGGGSGGAGGGAGGGSSNPADVEGTCTQTYLTDGDGGARPCQFGSNTPNGIVIAEDGGVITITPTVRPDSSFTLVGVPMGPYFVRIGTSWFKTTERRVSLDFESVGRVDGALAGANTTLTVNATNLQPWDDTSHFMSLYSSNSGVAMEAFSLYVNNPPFGGETSFNFEIPYELYSSQLQTPMLDSTRGDSVIVTQMAVDQNGEYRVLGSGAGSPVAMVSGQANTTSVSLASPPAAMTPLDITQSTFAMYQADFTAGLGPTLNVELSTGPKPVHDRGTDALAFVWGSYPQPGANPTLPNPLSYPNPFPATWGTTVLIQYGNTIDRTITGATTPRRYFSGLSLTLAIQALASPVAATLSPPREVQLNAMPFANAQTGVTRTPTVSWQAPTLGTVARYLLRVEQLQLSSGRATGRVVGSFYLLPTDTSFTLPPNILANGQSYVFVLSAYAFPGNPQRDLSTFPFPVASGTVVSGVVRP